MKKVLLLTGALMVVASAALAQGINFHWDDCTLGAPQLNKNDACDSNFGAPNKLIISVGLNSIINDVNGAQGVIDLQLDDATLNDFWGLEGGGCRAGRLQTDVNVGSGNAPFSCPEPWSAVGGTAGGAAFLPGVGGANRGRFTYQIAVPGTTSLDGLNIAPDWYIIALNLLKSNTTTCAGCAVPACLVANEVRLTKPRRYAGW